MANQFNTNPFTLTTTMGSSYKNTATAPVNGLRVRALQWTGGTAAQTCVVQDGHGNLLAQMVASTGVDSFVNYSPPVLWGDFQVTTLATGTLIMTLC